MKPLPLHPVLLAASAVLALLSANLGQVDLGVVARPLALSLACALALLAALRLALGDWARAGLAASLLLALFFSYGHLYHFLEAHPLLGLNLGRHRYLAVGFALAAGLGLWMILTRRFDAQPWTRALNLTSAALLLWPAVQIVQHSLRVSAGDRPAEISPSQIALRPAQGAAPPDVYFIVLDTYTRGDALRRDLGFDNGPFLESLRALGFYVAECSRTNYSYTQGALTAALNLDYLPALSGELEARNLGTEDIWVLLKDSLVRRALAALGYRTVAFETGYEWSRLADAEYYLGPGREPLALQRIQPFEALLVKSTAGLLLADSPLLAGGLAGNTLTTGLSQINFPHQDYIERQLFILAELPPLAQLPGPKFTFVHLLVPHPPFVFGPDGQIRSDPGFFGGEKGGPVNDRYEREGYTGEVQFINGRMLAIVESLIGESARPPIIILQGDHGLRKDNRLLILNALYLPGEGADGLYASISPVNTFRVIFNAYFGAGLELLPDLSFLGDDLDHPVPESAPECS